MEQLSKQYKKSSSSPYCFLGYLTIFWIFLGLLYSCTSRFMSKYSIGQVFKHGNNQRNHFPYFHDQCILVKYFWFGNGKPPPLVSGNNYNTIFHQTIIHNSTFPISSLLQNHRCRYFVNTLLNDIFISLRSTIKVVVFALQPPSHISQKFS